MSYDLSFYGMGEVTAAEFSAYFATRKHYKCDVPQAIYQNEDTGVYFIFDHITENEEDSETPQSNISLNLNFIRPHIFALEAEPEIKALVEAFSFTVFDPQIDGMGNGSFSSEAFFRGWTAGNEVGVRSILQQPNSASSIRVYPSDKIEQYWEWNRDRQSVQTQLGEGIFVPKICFLEKDNKAVSFVVWGDAIPSLIPEVDCILIPRKETAPSRFFRAKEQDCCLIPFQKAADVLRRYITNDFGLTALQLPTLVSPPKVVDFVRKLKPFGDKIQGLSVDKVLDQDLVDRFRTI